MNRHTIVVAAIVGASLAGASTVAATGRLGQTSVPSSAPTSSPSSSSPTVSSPNPSSPSSPSTGTGAETTGGTGTGATEDATTANGAKPATATISRGDLTTRHEFKATVTFGDKWTINTSATGVVTRNVEAGTVVEFGAPLIWVDNKPVILVAGATPVYRELLLVNTKKRDANNKRLTLLTGDDVTQLQQFLFDQGFDAKGKLKVDGKFGSATQQAVKAWQKAAGLPVTGKVDASQIVFNETPTRIATAIRAGSAFSAIEVTGASPRVIVEASNTDHLVLRDASTLEVEVPNGPTFTGTITDQRKVTKDDGSQVWRTSVTADGELPADGDATTVWATQTAATDALIVPTSALLAVAGGGFAVEVIRGSTTELVGVEVGEVLDAKASITGNVADGDEVVIAS